MNDFTTSDTQRREEVQKFDDLTDSLLDDDTTVKSESLEVIPRDPAPTGVLELRQIAGLTAGTSLPLDRGSFHFRNGGENVHFSLHVESQSRVMVVPGEGFIRINNEDLTGPTRLGTGVLDVGNARFVVRQRSTERRLPGDEILTDSHPIITVPGFSQKFIAGTLAASHAQKRKRGIFGGLTSGRWADPGSAESPAKSRRSAAGQPTFTLDGTSWEFMDDIRDVRNEQADRHRAVHPHPEETLHRLKSGGHGLWTREPHHALFGRVAIAYADLSWSPLFDDPDAIPDALRPHIASLSTLPSVPVTANLPIGPLGIFGHRPSALAVARQALLAIATTSMPNSFEFGVFADDSFVNDWEWVNNLPETFFSADQQSQSFIFADGELGYQRAAELHPIVQREAGVVTISDTLDGLPADCGTVVQVDENGYCRVTNHLGEMIDATPLGVTEEFADDMAQVISQTIA